MRPSNVPLEARHSGEEQRSYIKAYVEKIKLRFAQDELAGSYYFQLIDYIKSDVADSAHIVPIPTVTQIRNPHDRFIHQRAGKCWGFDVPFENMSEVRGPCIVAVEGLPSPACVAFLGAKFDIKPEFWLENLGLNNHDTAQEPFYGTPSLPSSRENIAHIRIPCLGRRTGGSNATRLESIERLDMDRKTDFWNQRLFQRRQYGSTRLRKIHLHDSQHFSIEQNISFCVSTKNSQNWTGLFLIDQGHEVPELEETPWSRYTRRGQPPYFLPIITHSQGLVDYNFQRTPPKFHNSSLNAFRPRDHLGVSSEEDVDHLYQSPFLVLASLLARAAAAWNQLLNFVDADINSSQINTSSGPKALGLAIEQMRSDLSLLSRAEESLKSNMLLIQNRGCSSWPGPSDSAIRKVLDKTASILMADYSFICDRCHELTQKCEANSKTLSNSVSLIETRESMEQAIQVHRLTTVAILFAPVSFVASVFGMNVDQLKDNPPIWIFFAVAIPVCFLTILLLLCWRSEDQGFRREAHASGESIMQRVGTWKDRMKALLLACFDCIL